MPPVEDHAVHETVKIAADKPYGCSSRRGFASGYYSPQRVQGFDGMFTIEPRWIPYRMSTACRNFYLWDTDPRCSVCTAERDNEYADRMRGIE